MKNFEEIRSYLETFEINSLRTKIINIYTKMEKFRGIVKDLEEKKLNKEFREYLDKDYISFIEEYTIEINKFLDSLGETLRIYYSVPEELYEDLNTESEFSKDIYDIVNEENDFLEGMKLKVERMSSKGYSLSLYNELKVLCMVMDELFSQIRIASHDNPNMTEIIHLA